MSAAQLEQLWVRAGRPGAEKLYDKAIREGLVVTRKAVQDFLQPQAIAQIFKQRGISDGKVVATDRRQTWQVDLIDFKQFSAKGNRGYKYILVAVDVFDRTMQAAPMKTKTPEETLRVFRSFAPFPAEVDTDEGNEFKGAFQNWLDRQGIRHRTKAPNQINALAVGDAAIGQLKTALGKDMAARSSGAWFPGLKATISAYNNRGHSALMGSQPSDVAGNPTLIYELRAKAGENVKHNVDVTKATAEKLERAGAFRTMLPRKAWDREHQPKWDNPVHRIASIEGPDVVDRSGERYPIKMVLPVPASSAEARAPPELRGGRPARVDESKRILRPFADALNAELAGRAMSLQLAGRRMRSKEGFEEALEEAKIIGFGAFRRFVALFPMFVIEGRAPRLTVRPRGRG